MTCLIAFAMMSSQLAEPPFWNDVQKFVHEDLAHPPAKGQILFLGSSSFTKWTDVQSYFPTHPIINRGFGGSCLTDLIFYADKVIYPYKPKQVVIYCGENDLAADATLPAYGVLDRFKELYRMIRGRMPNTPIVYISMKPSPSRWSLRWKMMAANRWIEQFIRSQKNAKFVDVFDLMLGPDGRPMKDIFMEDQLHMNEKGYAIWRKALEPVLAP